MDQFKLVSQYKPSGDQPQAIEGLVNGVNWGLREQTLLGVTGSGKTFTMASVIEKLNRPTLVLAHNHPSGIALPSNEDVATTKRIMKALAAIQVVLVDHVIVAEDDYVSLAQSGLIGPEDAEY